MARRKSRAYAAELDSTDSFREPPRRRSRRWLVLWPVLLLLLAVAWFAPLLVANSGLQSKIVSAALKGFEGRVRVGHLSLGWLSPIVAQKIEIVDVHDQPLLQVAAVRTQKSLFSLLWQPGAVGVIAADQPRLNLILRQDGSNLEDAFAALLNRPAQTAGGTSVRIEVRNGAAEILQLETGQRWAVAQLNADVDLPADGTQASQARLAGQISTGAASPGTLTADVSWQVQPSPEGALSSGRGSWKSDSLPLAPLSSLARRGGWNVQVQGVLSSEGSCQWNGGGRECVLQLERLAAQNFVLSAPAWLGRDVLQTERLEAAGHLEGGGAHWQAQELSVTTDFAKLEAHGRLTLRELPADRSGEVLLTQLAQEPIQVSGQIDLARLARLLPNTLRIRPSTQIKSGQVKFSLASQAPPTPGWTASLETSNLAAENEGRELVWEQPLVCVASLRATPEGPVVDRLTCSSSFLNLSGTGTLTQGSATLQGDLRRLATELGQFVDLGDCRLSGRLDGQLDWRREGTAGVTASGQISLQDFELTVADHEPWREASLAVTVAATAAIPGQQIEQLSTLQVQLQAGTDLLRVELLKPVDKPGAGSAWPLRGELRGQLATWRPRLQPFVVWRELRQIQGQADVKATAVFAPDRLQADTLVVDCQNLQVVYDFPPRGGEPPRRLALEEPTLHLETAALWQRTQRQLTLQNTTLTSSTLALRSAQLALLPSGPGLPITGAASVRSDLGRLSQWLQDPRQPVERRLAGMLSGMIQVQPQAEQTQVEWSGEVQDLVYAVPQFGGPASPASPSADNRGWREVWRQAKLSLAGKQTYTPADDQLQIDELSITSDALRLTAAGQVAQVSTRCVADLNGQVAYDWKTLSPILTPYLGERFQLTGSETSPFTVRGPLAGAAEAAGQARPNTTFIPISDRHEPAGQKASRLASADLAATAGLGWQSGQLYGLTLGQGRLQAKLADSVLRCEPLDLPVSEGRIKAAPWIELTTASPTLRVEPGQVIENVRISPELCGTWLKYVAPLVADATRAEGRFSLTLERATVPMDNPQRADVRGTLLIHAGQVGAGPLAQEFLTVAQQVRGLIDGRAGANDLLNSPWLLLPQQELRFEVTDGRVQHQGLTMTVQDVTIRTSGSVGLDQTLALTAEIPIRDEWVNNRQYLSALRGTVVKIPVSGNLAKPRLDAQALRDLGRQTLRNAAGKVLENEVQRGLDRLLNPRP